MLMQPVSNYWVAGCIITHVNLHCNDTLFCAWGVVSAMHCHVRGATAFYKVAMQCMAF